MPTASFTWIPPVTFTIAKPRAKHFGIAKQDCPDRYIRRVRSKFQARPYDMGERYDLGLFCTIGQARAAIREFWWGHRPSLPRFVRRSRTGRGYLARVRVGNQSLIARYQSSEEAAASVRQFLIDRLGEVAAKGMLRRQ